MFKKLIYTFALVLTTNFLVTQSTTSYTGAILFVNYTAIEKSPQILSIFEKQAQLQQKHTTLMNNQKCNSGSHEHLVKKLHKKIAGLEKSRKQLIQKFMQIVEAITRKKNAIAALPTYQNWSWNNSIYIDPTYDITQEVMDEFNKLFHS